MVIFNIYVSLPERIHLGRERESVVNNEDIMICLHLDWFMNQ